MKHELKLNANYRHFKGGMYRTLYLANSVFDTKKYVVYEQLNTGDIYIREHSEFLSEVDTVKYPDVKQKHRFKLVNQF